jgi:hypothetical protein
MTVLYASNDLPVKPLFYDGQDLVGLDVRDVRR